MKKKKQLIKTLAVFLVLNSSLLARAEYQNLNYSLLESRRDLLREVILTSNKDTGISLGGYYGNYGGGGDLVANFEVFQIGAFTNYKTKENTTGVGYDKNNINVFALGAIGENSYFGYGYSYSQNKYDKYGNSAVRAKLKSNSFIMAGAYQRDFSAFSYQMAAIADFGKYDMEKRDVSKEDFYTYSISMLNVITKEFDTQFLDYSRLNLGMRTIFWGHTDTNLDFGNKLEEKYNFSNSLYAGLDFGKIFWMNEVVGLGFSTSLEYEKDLIDEKEWRDTIKINGVSTKLGPTCTQKSYGEFRATLKTYFKFDAGWSVGAFLKFRTNRDAEAGIEIMLR